VQRFASEYAIKSRSRRFLVQPLFRYMRMQLYCISARNAMMFSRSIRAFVCALVALGATAVMARAEDLNDYPTAARADCVFGCMKANARPAQRIGSSKSPAILGGRQIQRIGSIKSHAILGGLHHHYARA
jgi:hypothetical protein